MFESVDPALEWAFSAVLSLGILAVLLVVLIFRRLGRWWKGTCDEFRDRDL